jgi:riboflavin biosynthesis pyrimidine reductase
VSDVIGQAFEMRRLRTDDSVVDVLEPYLDDRRREAGTWVLANMVASLAGSASAGGRVGGLSTSTDAELFRSLRAVADVVLVGAETVRRERYGPVRLPPDRQEQRVAQGMAPVPPLAIVSGSLDLDATSGAFTEAAVRTIVLTCPAAPPERRSRLEEVAEVISAGNERVDVSEGLRALGDRGHHVVLCEGGPTLLGELVAADRLDELCLTMSAVIGGDPLPIIVNRTGGADLRRYRLVHALLDEDDALFLRYTRRP